MKLAFKIIDISAIPFSTGTGYGTCLYYPNTQLRYFSPYYFNALPVRYYYTTLLLLLLCYVPYYSNTLLHVTTPIPYYVTALASTLLP